MELTTLALRDFRNYRDETVELSPAVTALVGANGEGKTNLLEAVGYVATLRSFRGAGPDTLVRSGAEQAVVRAEGSRNGRRIQVEAEIPRRGRGRVQLNRQRVNRRQDLLDAWRVTVFTPDDLSLVKEGPSWRRTYLDELLAAEQPRLDGLLRELERVLRQRNALLKQSGGRSTPDVETTLDVWDAKLVECGDEVGAERVALLDRLTPLVAQAYQDVAGAPVELGFAYESSWQADGLAAHLDAARADELRRGVSLVGPHRDDVLVTLEGLPARSQASQGEQRSLALALRLAAHRLVAEAVGSPPILLLDDLFSELDPKRAEALLAHLPAGQTILTSASGLPEGTDPDVVLRVAAGSVQVERSAA